MNIDKSWFRLDENRLEVEWVQQSERMMELCSELAEAKKRLNEANNALEVVTAEQDKDIRLHPALHGLDKVSEARVSHAITQTHSYQAATKAVVQAKYEVDMLQAAVTAMEHKKRALENLVDLYGLGYFAQPKAPSPEAQNVLRESKLDRAFGRRVQ